VIASAVHQVWHLYDGSEVDWEANHALVGSNILCHHRAQFVGRKLDGFASDD